MVRARSSRDGQRSVAVVGGGVAGLTAAYALQATAVEVTLYEAQPRLGGHADTHDVLDHRGAAVAVDTGFIVHNERTYPTLLRLFRDLGVATQDSDMSMSVHCEGCGLEYAGARGLRGLFAQPRSLRRADYLRMLVEVTRFHRQARRLLTTPGGSELTLDDFLRDGRYTAYFRQHFMTPVVSCVWSCAPARAGQYPARYLFQFLANHGMLSVTGSPPWKTVVGGSRAYVEQAGKAVSAVRTATPVTAVRRTAAGVEVTADGETLQYDAVVIATHADEALQLLAEPTPSEREVLGAFSYSRNETLLHGDRSLLPQASGAQASWNYRMNGCDAAPDTVLVSYDMNRLQRLETDDAFIVTLGGADRVDEAAVLDRMDYTHPIYTPQSVAAQARLPELSDARVAFAGAYHGWGFHEDGARSGLAAARRLGATW